MRFLSLLLPCLLLGAYVTPPDSGSTSGNRPQAVALIDIPANDPNIQYTGRWDFTDPLRPWCGWQGASVTIRFDGTDCSAILDPGNHREWFRVIVDGDQATTQKIGVDPGQQLVSLVNGLAPGVHRLDLVKETYHGSNSVFRGFRIQGNGLVAPPSRPAHRIEFYGDSNLAGYSLESERNQGDDALVGCHFGFAGVTARMLDAEYHNISISGETLRGMNSKYDRMMRTSNNPSWDFQRFQPDVVVVNLGANDVWRAESVIINDYHALLDDLRAEHPAAHIVLANGFGWGYDETADFTDQVVASRADPNMSIANFPWVFEQWHGCESDQAGMAGYLARHLSGVMGWTMSPSDVLDGFGRDGNVANGSFEGTAPFGGFAWRYADASGVRRIVNPALAFDGDTLLRLDNGGEVHQPNPASNGELVQVRMWMRGQGDAEITLDFRDQEMWTAPMVSQTFPVSLTGGWQEHRFQLAAPAQTPNPIFHTRLTIAATSGSILGVDRVQMRKR